MEILCIFDECFVGFFDFFYEFCYIDVFDGEGGLLCIYYVDLGDVDVLIVFCMYG